MNGPGTTLRVLIVVLVTATVTAAGSFTAGRTTAADPPRKIGQGWRDVCATVNPDAARPLDWRFIYRGVVVASGRCA